MTTIKLKNGSGAPTAGDLAQGEPALDLTNKRLYTEDSGGTVIEVGTNPTSITTGAITSTGIDVTGTVTADGLTLGSEGDQILIPTSAGFSGVITTGDTISGNAFEFKNGNAIVLISDTNDSGATGGVDATLIARGSSATKTALFDVNGDISFYEDTGTTAKFFWDSSAEQLKLGTIEGAAGGSFVAKTDSNGYALAIEENSGEERWSVGVDVDGDLGFFNSTDTTASVTFDDSGNVGIGTSSPDTQLTLYKASTNADVNYAKMRMDSWGASQGKLKSLVWDDSGNPVSAIGAEYDGSKTNIHFHSQYNGAFKGTSDRTMSIMGNGNVGIGTSSPQGPLHVYGGEYAYIGPNVAGVTPDSTTGGIAIGWNKSSGQGESIIAFNKGAGATGGLVFADNNGGTYDERMRIDSSGNLLVGRTLAGSGTGFEANTAFGSYILSTSTSIAGVFDRLSTDGEIVQFRKDGVAVGQINARSGDLVIGTGTTGLQFYDVGNAIFPLSASGNTNRDAAIDLGEGSNRFKDFYLSGRVVADGVTTSAHAWSSQSDSTSSSAHLYFRNPNGFVGNISTSGTATAYNTSSDYRLKENVVAMSGATERLKQLAPKRFNFIADADTTVDGFLAHEVADVVPEAVTGAKDAVDDDGNAVYQGIDQSKLVPLLVATIQELEARIAALESN